jgi:hypothetical protein
MHPVEHFFYYTCTLLPLLAWVSPALAMHPMHFLYAKFHADIAPIGGHDGFSDPGGNGAFHWLHHAHYEVRVASAWGRKCVGSGYVGTRVCGRVGAWVRVRG